MANKFVNIEDLNIDLIRSINPFYNAFEILSKSFTAPMLGRIKQAIDMSKIKMTDEEAIEWFVKIKEFNKEHGRLPDYDSHDQNEKRMAEAIIYLNNRKKEYESQI